MSARLSMRGGVLHPIQTSQVTCVCVCVFIRLAVIYVYMFMYLCACLYQNGYTPLHTSCYNGHLGVTRLLLDRGADMTRRDRVGLTHVYVSHKYTYV